ncbi:MAG TPA: hypothetical protein VKS60_02890 [Stellaceae bacterium]|nr:hypothetical protein [Stellaceae bacterium]
MTDLTPEQIANSFKNLGNQLQDAIKNIDDLDSRVKDLEDDRKEIMKRLAALEKKK